VTQALEATLAKIAAEHAPVAHAKGPA